MAEYTPVWFDDEDVAEWLEDNEAEVHDILREKLGANYGKTHAIANRLKNETPALAKGLNDEILTYHSRWYFINTYMPNVIYAIARGDGPVSLD